MNRRSFIVATAGFVLAGTAVRARGASTIVSVACNVEELDDVAEDKLAGLLHDRGVNVVDPSAIDARYHRQARVTVEQFLDATTVDYSSIEWVTAKYHAQRLLTVDLRVTSKPLPYGDFTVFNVRARASYRAFDTADRTIVGGGTRLGTGRGEDEDAAREGAVEQAMAAISADFARHVTD